MAIVLLALLVILILFGLGFTLHVLWWIALIALALWLLGFLLRTGRDSRPVTPTSLVLAGNHPAWPHQSAESEPIR